MFDVGGNKYRSKSSRKRNLSIKEKKKLMIIVTIILVILLLSVFYIKKQRDNYNYLKEDKSQYLVYSKMEQDDDTAKIYLPYVNMKSDIAKEVNEDINSFTMKYIKNGKSVITYDYDINGIILSLVVLVTNYDTTYAPETYCRTYNINLSTQELIANDALLNFFNVNEDIVRLKIENQFKYYYQQLLIGQYYQADECTYSCFLKYRGVVNYLDNVVYYVKGGDLYAYKPFTFESIFGEEKYFKIDHYRFLIAQSEKG